MNKKIFISIEGLGLIVKHRKSAVIFEIEQTQANDSYDFSFQFTSETFNEVLDYIETISNRSWSNLTPKEADSVSSDYFEYYDNKFDNNGYLKIGPNSLFIERPSLESKKLYQFNKKKWSHLFMILRNITIAQNKK